MFSFVLELSSSQDQFHSPPTFFPQEKGGSKGKSNELLDEQSHPDLAPLNYPWSTGSTSHSAEYFCIQRPIQYYSVSPKRFRRVLIFECYAHWFRWYLHSHSSAVPHQPKGIQWLHQWQHLQAAADFAVVTDVTGSQRLFPFNIRSFKARSAQGGIYSLPMYWA